MNTSVILLSRQHMRPCCLTPWVRQAISAVQWVKKNHLCLFTSIGMQTWEMLIYLAQSHEINQVVLIPAIDEQEFESLKESVMDQFKLNRSLTRFKAIMPEKNDCESLKLPEKRDSEAVTQADLVIPVSIRPKGNMAYLFRNITGKHGKVIDQFQIQYQKKGYPIAYQIEKDKLATETINIGDRYVVHWTRASNGPWPSEKKHAYFEALANSDEYPRTAFHTIQNIIKTGKIMASSAHMPKGIATVSFSGLAPDKILSLMKWRRRYRQMSFEPYGIGIEKTAAYQLGIVPVYYYHKKEYPKNKPPWQLQSGGVKADWKQESEFRYPGDFDLSAIAADKMVCFCHTPNEADLIGKSFGIKTYAFAR